MKKKQDIKKISLQKLRITKLNNLEAIYGGSLSGSYDELTQHLTRSSGCTITIAGTTQTRRPTQVDCEHA